MFQTFLHMHVYCLNIQLFFLFFFFSLKQMNLNSEWCCVKFNFAAKWFDQSAISILFDLSQSPVLYIFWKNGKPDFIWDSINHQNDEWLSEKLTFRKRNIRSEFFFRMTHFWDESSELVLNHFSRRESRSEYWETYQVHREIQFYTDINLLKGETGIT